MTQSHVRVTDAPFSDGQARRTGLVECRGEALGRLNNPLSVVVGRAIMLEDEVEVERVTAVDYHGSRLIADPRRDVLWQCLWRYRFSAMVGPDDCVLDLSAVYCNFINSVSARRRTAVDAWDGFPAYLAAAIAEGVA